ncbi:MAG: MFS transporter, partial [Solirubrobacterales bacterium]
GIAPLSGRISDRVGSVWPMSVGLAVLTTATFLFSQVGSGTRYGDLLPAFCLMGAGIALVMSPMSTAAMNAVRIEKAGIASGVLQMSRMIGGTVGVAATGAIFQAKLGSAFNPAALATGGEQARAGFIDALGSAMGLAAIVAAIGFLVAVALIRGRGQTAPASTRESEPRTQPEVAATAPTPEPVVR